MAVWGLLERCDWTIASRPCCRKRRDLECCTRKSRGSATADGNSDESWPSPSQQSTAKRLGDAVHSRGADFALSYAHKLKFSPKGDRMKSTRFLALILTALVAACATTEEQKSAATAPES